MKLNSNKYMLETDVAIQRYRNLILRFPKRKSKKYTRFFTATLTDLVPKWLPKPEESNNRAAFCIEREVELGLETF